MTFILSFVFICLFIEFIYFCLFGGEVENLEERIKEIERKQKNY